MISKRARYALHGVSFLASHSPADIVPFARILKYLRDYSSGLTLSPGYISKIFQDLSRAGIVQASVGRKGGYSLARDSHTVRAVDIVGAVDGLPVEQCCLLSVGGCDRQETCGVNSLIRRAQETFYDFLAGETAASLAEKMFGAVPPVDDGTPPRES